ncbi:Multisubstrate pseudouridine synthase [Actinidia chinensis var. chinensis]|uniref:Multisubstrate pseudouridine synthase n=1 Tax=Actinidia chinensis var. chinensis TaxID=1590841 RepID=A0A2R6RDS6_ACTCC|nr:Multisubstrate pseudouridine synthase [Actinidia chinensis var. chinensis]
MLHQPAVSRTVALLYYYARPRNIKPYYNHHHLSLKLKPYSSSKTRATESGTLETAMKTLDEADVGIVCYISPLPGFRGILKQRYSDFIVNEVDLDGNVTHLTNLESPPEIVEDKEIKISDQLNNNYDTEIESFKSLAGDSDADVLEAFIQQISSGVKDSLSPVILSPSSDKSHRTAVHNFFKEHFKFFVTDTVDGPDTSSKCIRVWFNAGGNNGTGRKSKKRKDRGNKPCDDRGSDSWPEHLDKFLRFHLYKENKDTQEALGLIGKMLGIQPRSFGFAGTKDKRSVSTQRVTVFKQRASRLAALNERLIGIKVGDFCHVKEGLLLGQLYGNRFTITLRGVVADSEDTIKASADALGKHGFINYFGLQRFGSGSVPTHFIGASLLRGEWKTAVSMILDPREGEKEFIRNAREYYKESNDIDGTLKQLPRHLVAERAILQCLKKCPGNYLQALKAIPRTLRMMYVHSYQSYLWNHAASMRVQKHGFDQVVLGDLVYSKVECAEKVTTSFNSESEDNSCDNTYDCSQLDEISETALPEEINNSVKAIGEEDLVAGIYTIEDVILPLPGSRIIYPSNDTGIFFHDLAKKDDISLTESVHSVKEFSITNMTGGYRRVFQKPMDFKWELLTYIDGNIPLAETDLDIIAKSRPANVVRNERSTNGDEGVKLPFNCMKQQESYENAASLSTCKKEGEDDREVKVLQQPSAGCSDAQEVKMALKLSFTLPASCYATMAIRELLKTSTSVSFHKTLNQ